MSEKQEAQLKSLLNDLADILDVVHESGVVEPSEAEEVGKIMEAVAVYGIDSAEKLKEHGFDDKDVERCENILVTLKSNQNGKLN